MVLARTPEAPEGNKGISVFLVPKFIPNDDGSIGKKNDVTCLSIEKKLGVKGSPTAVYSLVKRMEQLNLFSWRRKSGFKYYI